MNGPVSQKLAEYVLRSFHKTFFLVNVEYAFCFFNYFNVRMLELFLEIQPLEHGEEMTIYGQNSTYCKAHTNDTFSEQDLCSG